ncbi:MAG TPA: 2-iminoacetate synthase ThiH [Acidimicrobiales bacterium]|nr:2-iminoacetate synthase ThiH [Acidimicrobiales bacterium]
MTAVPVELAVDGPAGDLPPGTAAADLAATDQAPLLALAHHASATDVERALSARRPGLADAAALLSPAAATRLEDMAQAARHLTVRRFGHTVHLFAPLYLSNECVSVCTYCGFSAGNDIPRRTLAPEELVAEARSLVDDGLRTLLLVAGEHARVVSKDYLVDCVAALAPHVPALAVEVQAWDTPTYRRLVEAGCDGLVVYQETYDTGTYAATHLRGKKRNYQWRLAAPDRGAAAGMRRLGIGALLGLHPDWRAEAVALVTHARALQRRWWRCELTISLPRLRPAAGGFEPAAPVGDRDLAQLVCALRLALPDVALSLSTREPPALRDALLPLGITQLSAGSRTEPGGYRQPGRAGAQFEIADSRSPAEVAAMVRSAGYEPVWKDWERG